jgi:hypothetical protein
MGSLQTVAMGLVVVFLDVGSSGWDWIADPVGWALVLLGLAPLKDVVPTARGLAVSAAVCLAISVLTYPPESVDTLDESFGWLFSLPTILFCYLLCDALREVAEAPYARRLGWLRVVFVVVGLLPVLVYGAEWDWLTVPTAVLAVLANLTLVMTLWSAGADAADSADSAGPGSRSRSDSGFDAEQVRSRSRNRRNRDT